MKKIGLFFFLIVSLMKVHAQNDSLYIESFDSLQTENLDTILSMENQTIIEDSIVKKSNLWTNFKSDAHLIGGSFINGFTQPTRWQKDDYIKAGVTVAGISMLYLADEPLSDFFRKQEDHVPHGIRKAGWVFGRPEASYGLTSGIYLYGLFTNNEKVRETGVLLISSAAISGVLQQVTKTVVGRGRPHLDKGHNQFKLFKGGDDYGSFPSGHSILSTTVIYGLSKQFSNPWVKAGFYTVGLLTPVSRLWAGAHWFTDVSLSVVTSIAIVEGVDSFLKKKKNKALIYKDVDEDLIPKQKIKWTLNAGPSSIGIIGVF